MGKRWGEVAFLSIEYNVETGVLSRLFAGLLYVLVHAQMLKTLYS
jgi:hypothetical protein